MISLIQSSTYFLIDIVHFIALTAALFAIFGEFSDYKNYVKFSKYYNPPRYGIIVNFFLQTLINALAFTFMLAVYAIIISYLRSEVSLGPAWIILLIVLAVAISGIIASIGSAISRKGYINLARDPIAKNWLLLSTNEQKEISAKRRSDYLHELKVSVFTWKRTNPS